LEQEVEQAGSSIAGCSLIKKRLAVKRVRRKADDPVGCKWKIIAGKMGEILKRKNKCLGVV
jgi:hypothetical protein